jgi:CHAT domain-containing protein
MLEPWLEHRGCARTRSISIAGGTALFLWTIFGEGMTPRAIALPSIPNPLTSERLRVQTIALSSQWSRQARLLTREGHQYFARGNYQKALELWQEAERLYRQLGDRDGIVGSQINQSVVFQTQGQYRRACKVLVGILPVEGGDLLCEAQTEDGFELACTESHCGLSTAIEKLALQNLGEILREIGKLKASETVLQQALKLARSWSSGREIAVIELSLANTQRARYNRQRSFYDRTEQSSDRIKAIELGKGTLERYRRIARRESEWEAANGTRSQALFNALSLLVEIAEWLKEEGAGQDDNAILTEEWRQLDAQIEPTVEQLVADPLLFSGLSAIEEIYARLNFAHTLMQWGDRQYGREAIAQIQLALGASRQLNHTQTEIYASGLMGMFYQKHSNLNLAREWTERAVVLSEAIAAPELSYRWQQQLGNIAYSLGEIPMAIAAYEMAVEQVEQVRQDLLSLEREVQFSFQETVRDIYEDYIFVLLKWEPFEDRLATVAQLIDRFGLAELENFLGCELSIESQPDSDLQDNPAAILYAIVLEKYNSIAIVVKVPDGSERQFYYYSVQWQAVKRQIKSLNYFIEEHSLNTRINQEQIAKAARELYQLLIQPTRDLLPDSGTLVFVTDSLLQTIPMAMLQDEQGQYLIEKYSLAFSLRSQLDSNPPPSSSEPRGLLAGVRNGPSFGTNFDELPAVKRELQEVQAEIGDSKILLDEDFTRDAFEKQINHADFSIVHIATHGEFSSDPQKTFILAFDDPINVRQFDRFVRRRIESSLFPIDLLVLSACETAKSDRRGGLGLAGVAVQAGARSTLASLWKVSDGSTALFMREFYRHWRQSNLTKAEALRQAQLTFLHEPQYRDQNYHLPYYWAAFVLAGDWH